MWWFERDENIPSKVIKSSWNVLIREFIFLVVMGWCQLYMIHDYYGYVLYMKQVHMSYQHQSHQYLHT